MWHYRPSLPRLAHDRSDQSAENIRQWSPAICGLSATALPIRYARGLGASMAGEAGEFRPGYVRSGGPENGRREVKAEGGNKAQGTNDNLGFWIEKGRHAGVHEYFCALRAPGGREHRFENWGGKGEGRRHPRPMSPRRLFDAGAMWSAGVTGITIHHGRRKAGRGVRRILRNEDGVSVRIATVVRRKHLDVMSSLRLLNILAQTSQLSAAPPGRARAAHCKGSSGPPPQLRTADTQPNWSQA